MNKIFFLIGLLFVKSVFSADDSINKTKLTDLSQEVLNRIFEYSSNTNQHAIGNKLLSKKFLRYILSQDSTAADRWLYLKDKADIYKIGTDHRILMSSDRTKFVDIDRNGDKIQILTINPSRDTLGELIVEIDLKKLIGKSNIEILFAKNTNIDNVLMVGINDLETDLLLFIDLDDILNNKPNKFKPVIIEEMDDINDLSDLMENCKLRLSSDKRYAVVKHTALGFKIVFDILLGEAVEDTVLLPKRKKSRKVLSQDHSLSVRVNVNEESLGMEQLKLEGIDHIVFLDSAKFKTEITIKDKKSDLIFNRFVVDDFVLDENFRNYDCYSEFDGEIDAPVKVLPSISYDGNTILISNCRGNFIITINNAIKSLIHLK